MYIYTGEEWDFSSQECLLSGAGHCTAGHRLCFKWTGNGTLPCSARGSGSAGRQGIWSPSLPFPALLPSVSILAQPFIHRFGSEVLQRTACIKHTFVRHVKHYNISLYQALTQKHKNDSNKLFLESLFQSSISMCLHNFVTITMRAQR